MKTEIIKELTNNFESYANKTESDVEFWLARDLQTLLGYDKWDNFKSVISKAKIACDSSGHKGFDHFADVGKTIQMPKGRALADFAPTIILKAKDFATEITIFNAKANKMQNEQQISNEHVTNHRSVRNTLLERGIKPENLPADEDIKKVERKLKSTGKKGLENLSSLATT